MTDRFYAALDFTMSGVNAYGAATRDGWWTPAFAAASAFMFALGCAFIRRALTPPHRPAADRNTP